MENKPKDKNLNVKFPEEDYRKLQKIADDIGGMSLASMVKMLIYRQLEKVKNTGDSISFLDLKK